MVCGAMIDPAIAESGRHFGGAWGICMSLQFPVIQKIIEYVYNRLNLKDKDMHMPHVPP
jgi:hypothetical protein